MEEIKNLINSIRSEKVIDIEHDFNQVMSMKVSDALDTMRQSVAKGMFSAPQETQED